MRTRSIILFLLLNLVLVGGAYSQTSRKTYVDKKHRFSVKYPSDFKVLVGKKAASETAFGDPGKGNKLMKVSPRHIPEKFHGDYEFNVWQSSDPKTKCGEIGSEEDTEVPIGAPAAGSPKTRTIGGHTFYAYEGSDGGMSKSLGLSGYRGLVGGKCWQIQSVTYQVSAFDDFKSFNGKIIDKAFEKFVSSFKFN